VEELVTPEAQLCFHMARQTVTRPQ